MVCGNLCLDMHNKPDGDALAAFRKARRYTQDELAKLLGTVRGTYKNWEYGLAEIPDAAMTQLRKLGFGSEVGEPTIPAIQLLVPIPYLGGIGCSDFVNWTDPFESDTFEFVPPEMGDARGRFSCRALGDSMFDLIYPDDLLVFQRHDTPKIGTVCLYRHSDMRMTIKLLKHDGQNFTLHALNPKYPDVVADGQSMGYLVGIVREMGSRRVTVYDSLGIRP